MDQTDFEPSEARLREALDAFVMDATDLEQLEDELCTYNLFEAIGVRRQELRHSDFLRWLLDPYANHGVGDLVLRRFLQRAVYNSDGAVDLSPVDFDYWDLSDAKVERESSSADDRSRADILIASDQNKFVGLIENKIGSGEGVGQLLKYRSRLSKDFAGYRQLLIFLTSEGAEASDATYVGVSYELVAQLLDDLLDRRGNVLSRDVETSIRHYVQMLRRYVVPNSELATLARRIYEKHKIALDYIFEQRPDFRSDLRVLIEKFLREQPSLSLDDSAKHIIRFADRKWDEFVPLQQSVGWTTSKRMFLGEIYNSENKIRLALVLGPGPMETRNRVYSGFQRDQTFKTAKRELTQKFTRVWSGTLVEYDETEISPQDVVKLLEPKLHSFFQERLPRVTSILEQVLRLDWQELPK